MGLETCLEQNRNMMQDRKVLGVRTPYIEKIPLKEPIIHH